MFHITNFTAGENRPFIWSRSQSHRVGLNQETLVKPEFMKQFPGGHDQASASSGRGTVLVDEH